MNITVNKIGWEQVADGDYFRYFASQILRSLPEGATVFDAGCGEALHPAYAPIRKRSSVIWGCDPNPEAQQNSSLDRFIEGDFNAVVVENSRFDLVLANYVLEHLSDPLPFFVKAREILRPGGTFAFLTPNRKHPFCQMVRLAENLRIKSMFRACYGQTPDSGWRINDYPALYRANTAQDISDFARRAGFREGMLCFVPAGWQYYFPKGLRFLPNMYDRYLAAKRKEGHLILVGLLKA